MLFLLQPFAQHGPDKVLAVAAAAAAAAELGLNRAADHHSISNIDELTHEGAASARWYMSLPHVDVLIGKRLRLSQVTARLVGLPNLNQRYSTLIYSFTFRVYKLLPRFKLFLLDLSTYKCI